MMGLRIGAASAVLLLTTLSSAAFADPATCKAQCGASYQTCAKNSSQDACVPKWMQCKRTCAGTPVAVAPAPAPAKVAVATSKKPR